MHHALQKFRAVEVLLLLEQEGIRRQGKAACGFAVSRVRERDRFVVREVGTVIYPLAWALDARQLCRGLCWAIVGALEQGGQLDGTRIPAGSPDSLSDCLEWMSCHSLQTCRGLNRVNSYAIMPDVIPK